MENIKLLTIIRHKSRRVMIGRLTALRGGLNQARIDKEVQLNNKWTGLKLVSFEEYKI